MKARQSTLVLMPKEGGVLQRQSPSRLSPSQNATPGPIGCSKTIDLQTDDVTTVSQTKVGLQRHVAMMTGVAVAVTAAGIAHVTTQTPEYEGEFQLTVQPVSPATQAVNSPQIDAVNETIAIPTLSHTIADYSTQIRILQSPRILNPVLEQLHAQNLEIDYAELTSKLQIDQHDPGVLTITYRDRDPDVIQKVLQQVAVAYLQYGQECKADACRGMEFIDAQLPKVDAQIKTLQTKLKQLQLRQGSVGPAVQQQFSDRVNEISRQGTEIQVNLAEANRQLADLQRQLGAQPNDAIATAILSNNARYQTVLQKLYRIDSQIAAELSRVHAKGSELKPLNQQYQATLTQLQQVAQQSLKHYLYSPEGSDWLKYVQADPARLEYLQRSVNTAHYIQVLQVRQQTIVVTERLMREEMRQLAVALSQQSELERELKTATLIQTQYLEKRESLRAQAATSYDTAWQVTTPPNVLTNKDGNPAQIFPQLPRDLAAGAVLGLLLGLGVANATQKRYNVTRLTSKEQEFSSMSDYQRSVKRQRLAYLQAGSNLSLRLDHSQKPVTMGPLTTGAVPASR